MNFAFTKPSHIQETATSENTLVLEVLDKPAYNSFSLRNSQYRNNKVWQLISQTFFSRVKVTYVTTIQIKHLCSKLHILRSTEHINTAKALDTMYNDTHKSLARRSVTSSSQLTNFFFLTKERLRTKQWLQLFWGTLTQLLSNPTLWPSLISCLVYQCVHPVW